MYGRPAENIGSTARPSRPRSMKSSTFVLRSTYRVGVGSETLSYSFTTPVFCATNTWPSGAQRTAVGEEQKAERDRQRRGGGAQHPANLCPHARAGYWAIV